jgi:GMP synthase (glutamine-hydrolysing)
VPAFGICYGFQAMARALGGDVAKTGLSEFGRTEATVATPGHLLAEVPRSLRVWMSHGDSVAAGARRVHRAGRQRRGADRRVRGHRTGAGRVQWHPEVLHTEAGQKVLENFLFDIAGCRPDWTPANIVDDAVQQIQAQVGDKNLICGLSGGVDSAVAAALVQRAVGSQLTCVFVDHGLLRLGRGRAGGAGLRRGHRGRPQGRRGGRPVPGRHGRGDRPETKRKIIGREFIRTFEAAAREVVGEAGEVEFLVQGTLYPDVVESGGGEGAANIKSHHNVGGLPDDLQFRWSSRCARCSRTRCGPWASSWACRRRSSGGIRSRGPGWASGSSAR